MNRLVAPNSHRPRQAQAQSGFTLIEVLVVITIIALLVALLLPAIGGVRRSAKVSECSFEIKAIESALVAAKDRFGGYPPSSFVLFENPIRYNSTQSGIADTLRVRSKEFIRQAWPQFAFQDYTDTAVQTSLGLSANDYDFNANSSRDDAYILTGAECLVFFLGGLPKTDSVNGLNTCQGFSKNPLLPFLYSGTREGPYFNFAADRLVLSSVSARQPFCVYCDKLGSPKPDAPYGYLSSYDGRSYQAADAAAIPLSVGFPYIPGVPGNTPGIGDLAKATNPKTYQIISPGFDRKYGRGGFYDIADRNNQQPDDADNITNFSTGTLGN